MKIVLNNFSVHARISQHSNLNIYIICIQGFTKTYYNVPSIYISVNQFVCCMHAHTHTPTHTHNTHTHTHNTHTHTHTQAHKHTHTQAQTHKHEHTYIHTPHNTRAHTHQLLSLTLLSPNKSGDKQTAFVKLLVKLPINLLFIIQFKIY